MTFSIIETANYLHSCLITFPTSKVSIVDETLFNKHNFVPYIYYKLPSKVKILFFYATATVVNGLLNHFGNLNI